MSKDIWHFPSEAPEYCFLCVFENSFDGEIHCGHYNPVKKQFCSTEGRYEINQVKKYCDLLHLLDCEQELIRTRKALDVVVDALKEIDELLSSNRFDVREVPLLNITQTKISMLLKCINIKQKESAFVHNKIEFPEYNDNLLEEFDKQFFENGQDDDLTETALEQKD